MSGTTFARVLRSGFNTLPEGLLIAALYASLCWATRQISLDQFLLPAGIRVAALLMSPVRMWPYLLLGDYLYLAQLRIPMLDRYGAEWVIVSSAYQFPAAALVVYLNRRLIVGKSDAWLLSVAATAALLIGVGNLALAHLLWPSPPHGGFIAVASRYVLGHYVAVLTIAPLAVLWTRRREVDWSSWREAPSVYAAASLLAFGVASTLPPQLLPTLLSDSAESVKSCLQLLMALPVIALTCMHGWRGAAVGVPMMNLVVHFSTSATGLPDSFDASTFHTQQSLAIASTSLFALGSIAGYYRDRFRTAQQDQSRTLSLVKACYLASEKDLRARALRMRQIGENIDASQSLMVDWLNGQGHRQFASAILRASTVRSQQFREQTSMVYPTSLEHVGLYLALQIGGIHQEWERTERVGRPLLLGDPCNLSTGLQLAAYRSIVEGVSLLLEQEKGQVQVRARCGRVGRVQGILVTVGLLDSGRSLSSETLHLVTERLTSRSLAYRGRLQGCGNRVRLLLVEQPKETNAARLSAVSKHHTLQRA